ncbi:MAG: lactate racemase domain-containing protein, partial [Planctomycetota bacterium]
MASISIPWGDRTLSLELPAEWTVQQTVAADLPPAPSDWRDLLARALTRPEGAAALGKLLRDRPGGRIAVIVEDLTRHSPLEAILKIIFRELTHAEIPPENIEIVFATGMHPPLTPAEAAAKIGPELASTIRWRCNPWRDRDAYRQLPTVREGSASIDLWIDRRVVSADLRIVVTSVSPHLQAGFGGGYKMLLPGCARLDSIRHLHLCGVPRQPVQQVGQTASENRMRRLIEAAGAAVDAAGGRTFGVQYVLDGNDQPAAIAAGDVSACYRMLAKTCAAGCGVLVDAPADVVIANAAPRDYDLWQSFKAVANTCWAVRDNGVLICLARCPGGANMPTVSLPIRPSWVRAAVRLAGADPLANLLTRLVPTLAGDAAFFVRLALRILQRTTVMMVSPALAEAGAGMVGLPMFGDPAEATAAAEQALGPGPKRVLVFPR